jgi:predicted nucleotidyltransferase
MVSFPKVFICGRVRTLILFQIFMGVNVACQAISDYDTAMVRTTQDILDTLKGQKVALFEKYPIRRIALFGSWSRGEQHQNSDVDILVDVDPAIGLGFVSLADELEHILGHKVDLVSSRAIRASLWKQIEPDLIDA